MIILIAIVPAKFALDSKRDPHPLYEHVVVMQNLLSEVDTSQIEAANMKNYVTVRSNLDTLSTSLKGITSFSELKKGRNLVMRSNILVLSKKSDALLKGFASMPIASVDHKWTASFKKQISEVRTYTEYAPLWVILAIAISLGLGTMIGWKRIVVTIGEKIGKSHLTYAQGASAELIAAGTITVSSMFGLPVSTTHVLSSGIAGTMVAGSGFKNLQKKTVAAIGIAWLITLPVTILISGVLFLLLRMIFV
jgi:PiT family inorganic phosphate transporter